MSDETREHIASVDCWCKPEVEVVGGGTTHRLAVDHDDPDHDRAYCSTCDNSSSSDAADQYRAAANMLRHEPVEALLNASGLAVALADWLDDTAIQEDYFDPYCKPEALKVSAAILDGER